MSGKNVRGYRGFQRRSVRNWFVSKNEEGMVTPPARKRVSLTSNFRGMNILFGMMSLSLKKSKIRSELFLQLYNKKHAKF